MNMLEARWAELVFWDPEDVRLLHKREDERAARCAKLVERREPPIDEWDRGFIQRMRDKYFPNGYWAKALLQGDRDSRMEQFTRAIYPIWAPILKTEASDPAMAKLHEADKAIYQSGIKPNRGDVLERKPAAKSRDGWGE